MADPHIQSPMDVWDKLTVVIYRTGFVIAAFSILALTWYPQQAQIAVLIAATCCASSLHIYLKHFRLTFQFATWLALLCALLGWHELALGGALVTLGGLCFKEYFCFRVPLLNLQPAHYTGSVDKLVDMIVAEAKPTDQILVMSNGSFGGIHQKILERLK